MYPYLKSKLNWNTATIKLIWSLMIVFLFVFWYYSFKLFDFTIKLVTAFIF